MPIITVTVVQQIEVPEGSSVSLSTTGNVSTIDLPSGKSIKPWMTFEDAEREDHNLSYNELTDLGVDTDFDCSREVEGDVEIRQPA